MTQWQAYVLAVSAKLEISRLQLLEHMLLEHGCFKNIRNSFKRAWKIKQLFSATVPTAQDVLTRIKENVREETEFTDGCGLISPELLQEVEVTYCRMTVYLLSALSQCTVSVCCVRVLSQCTCSVYWLTIFLYSVAFLRSSTRNS